MSETQRIRPTEQTVSTLGGPTDTLGSDQVHRFIADHLETADLDGRSLCVLVPDGTRSCPLPLLVSAIHAAVHGRVSQLTVMIALGTHAAMGEAQLAAHLGYEPDALAERFPGMEVRNHEWWDPDRLVSLGVIDAARVDEISEGRLQQEVDVRLNRAVIEHDVTLIVGPVFPHEVVGYSGGNKYLFPGVAGQEIIDLSHWLGALIAGGIIGTRGTTPVRAMINEAASMVTSELLAFCLVVESGSDRLHSIAFGEPHAAWESAAAVSAEAHVRYLDAPVRRVVSLIPNKYEDIWTGAKGFYKVEPVVADGGQVILYAPHITELSAMHPEIATIGYHNREYFVKQWDRFSHLQGSDLAHSVLATGDGTFDPDGGETKRVTVTLATAIPEDEVRAASLDYLDPAEVDIEAMSADPDTLVVHKAGEVLYRLR